MSIIPGSGNCVVDFHDAQELLMAKVNREVDRVNEDEICPICKRQKAWDEDECPECFKRISNPAAIAASNTP